MLFRSLDVILMRKDPPFDTEFIYATYILERAEDKGTLIVNKPQSLRDCNEKLFTAWFADLTPDTLVTRKAEHIREFYAKHGDMILKPLDGMGGLLTLLPQMVFVAQGRPLGLLTIRVPLSSARSRI